MCLFQLEFSSFLGICPGVGLNSSIPEYTISIWRARLFGPSFLVNQDWTICPAKWSHTHTFSYHSQGSKTQHKTQCGSLIPLGISGAILFFKIFIYLAALGLSGDCRIFNLHCSMQGLQLQQLVPWPRIKPRSPALGAWSLSHWTTRQIRHLGIIVPQALY